MNATQHPTIVIEATDEHIIFACPVKGCGYQMEKTVGGGFTVIQPAMMDAQHSGTFCGLTGTSLSMDADVFKEAQ
jgi:hypothetical protein